MKLTKKLLVGTLIISMIVLSGCGKDKSTSIDTPTSTSSDMLASLEPSETPKETSDETVETKEQKEQDETTSQKSQTEEEQLPIDAPEYANLEDLEGDTYKTKIPTGWTKGGNTIVNDNVENYNIISNSKLSGEIVITEQQLEDEIITVQDKIINAGKYVAAACEGIPDEGTILSMMV